MSNVRKCISTMNYLNSFQESINILERSFNDIKLWEYDIFKLEIILRENHGGWERLLKTYRLLFSQKELRGHNLVKLFKNIETKDMIFYREQNLDRLIFTSIRVKDKKNKVFDKYNVYSREIISYFELLDDLFDNTKNRYANIEGILGRESNQNLIDNWIKELGVLNNSCLYEDIRSKIIEINKIVLRFFALQFSLGGVEELKGYIPIFHDFYSYWNDKFI